jgi:tetratricopeptide (TPR) repeat protein
MRTALVACVALALAPVAGAAPPNARAVSAAYAAADRAFAAGDLIMARDLTRELTENFPDDPASWLRLAQIEERLGRFNESLAAYDSALDVEAAFSVDGGVQLARVRYQRAALLLAEAERELARSMSKKLGAPDDARRADVARVLAQAGVVRRATDAPRAALARAPEPPARGYVVETKEPKR